LISGLKNYNLFKMNSFGLKSIAREFYSISSVEELKGLLAENDGKPPFILGGGSNVLLPDFLDRTVVKLDFHEWESISDEKKYSILRVGAGWNWHEFVLRALSYDLGGIENLSLIPGTVGAAPIQNIGAYGVEIKDFIEQVEYLSFHDQKVRIFKTEECLFDYRSSIFKKELNGKGVITHVTFRLPKQGFYSFNISYSSLTQLADNSSELSAKKISDWVISIRESKLPNPGELGNAGSFFKNPIISSSRLNELKREFDTIPFYTLSDKSVKIPAAWLIDVCGWKGKREGSVGSYRHQPLVIVNYGNARANEVIEWARAIRKDVQERFRINLEAEVNILDREGDRLIL